MGQLIDGRWDDGNILRNHDEKGLYFKRNSVFRARITADGSSPFPSQSGRYHLYCSIACPWAHRTVLLRVLKKLDASAPHPDEELLLAKAGTVAVMNAHVWHGGTANRTDKPRLALHSFYCRRDQPQQQYQKQLLSASAQQQMTPEMRWLLALDDPLNDELSSQFSGRSGFLR